ncbi:hypothetical protein BX600DRAFT_377919 [Xylariales sp. PMI_506]|nr:hypothetical protein BX600DRAFT_377919 [Xylariales sp. PMI_506]
MFDTSIVGFEAGQGYLTLRGASILVDPEDYEGVSIAVENLACDLEKVTGHKPAIWTSTEDRPCVESLILVGSLQRCRFFSDLPASHAEGMQGKWETFETAVQDCPWSFASRMLVITGSDKRGAIFGTYTLSEQIGVSPWYWWADVPVQPREHVFALPITARQGEPSIQYRGVFINDEAPALCDWVHEKFGPVFNSEFYQKVFELLLRMKANFLWPAMWSGFPEPGNSFFTDDPLNQEMADRYGIVISTSHHEPMQRGIGEWRVGGAGPWSWETNKASITGYFAQGARRSQGFEDLIENVYGSPEGVSQVMALYKEVQGYYEEGLEIPEDVTLLFADDNFGNIRRLPTEKERARKGGIGLYYHLEYVGSPRSYKWMNTNSCGKIHQQLRLAFDSGVTKLWVMNVGDIKPLEMPLTFAMNLAWNINSVGPTTIPKFFMSYAERELGARYATDVAELLLKHDRLLALRRHEHIEPDTFSIFNYCEAENIIGRYGDQERRAAQLFDLVPESRKAAFFQLVLHPIRASRIFLDLQISLRKNRLYGEQRRSSTNAMAYRVLGLFDLDWVLTEEYHHSPWTGDKWNHIMKQPHYGFPQSESWHTPYRGLVTGLSFVQSREDSTPIAGQMGVAVEGHPGVLPGLVNEECCRMQPSRNCRVHGLTMAPLSPYGATSRYFEIYSRGTRIVQWNVSAAEDWLQFSAVSGLLKPTDGQDSRVEVTVDWNKVPKNFCGTVHIDIRSLCGDYEQVHLPLFNRHPPPYFFGAVESDGCVSIEVGSVPLSDAQRPHYQSLPHIGRYPAGGIALSPHTGTSVPYLEYQLFVFTHPENITVWLYFTMALDARPLKPLAYDIIFDDAVQLETPLLGRSNSGELPDGWSKAVQDGAWVRKHNFPLRASGEHTLQYRPLVDGLVLEKVVVDLGGVRESYLGPPPSSQVVGHIGTLLK